MYAPDFSHHHYLTVMEHLCEEYDPVFLRENRGAVKKGMIQFFADTHQSVQVAVYNDSIKIEKQIEIDEATDRAIFNARLMIGEFEHGIDIEQHCAHIQVISAEACSDLFECFAGSGKRRLWVKERLRQELILFYGLQKRDIVLFLKGVVYIIYFRDSLRVKSGVERRFAGWDPDELAVMLDPYFPGGADEVWEELQEYLPEVLNDQLNFTRISNSEFEERFIRVFRSMVEIFLHETMGDAIDDELTEPLSGYILRQQFDNIILFTAGNLLELFHARNLSAEKFIKAYQDTIAISPSGQKILRKAITDSKGQRWSAPSILSMMIQLDQAKIRITKQENSTAFVENRCKGAAMSLKNEESALKEAKEQRRETSAEVSASDMNLRALKRQKRIDEKELITAQKAHDILRASYRTTESQVRQIELRLNNKKSELTTWQRQLESAKKALKATRREGERIEESVREIQKAIGKSLVSR